MFHVSVLSRCAGRWKAFGDRKSENRHSCEFRTKLNRLPHYLRQPVDLQAEHHRRRIIHTLWWPFVMALSFSCTSLSKLLTDWLNQLYHFMFLIAITLYPKRESLAQSGAEDICFILRWCPVPQGPQPILCFLRQEGSFPVKDVIADGESVSWGFTYTGTL